jgi:hypothetical protein
MLSNIWVWDPGSEIRDPGSEIRDPEKNLFRIPEPGVKKAPDPGSGSATLLSPSLLGILENPVDQELLEYLPVVDFLLYGSSGH